MLGVMRCYDFTMLRGRALVGGLGGVAVVCATEEHVTGVWDLDYYRQGAAALYPPIFVIIAWASAMG